MKPLRKTFLPVLELPCPNCGSQVRFKSKASIYAKCEACDNMLVRQDVDVSSLGKVAQVQEDGTLLRLGTRGQYRNVGFEIIGRIQVTYGQGFWNEWYLQFDGDRNGWLGEAMGTYFVNYEVPLTEPVPPFEQIQRGMVLNLSGTMYTVSDIQRARVIGYEGELPFVMQNIYDAPVVDLRSASAAGATLDFSGTAPQLFLGEWGEFKDFHFTDLRDKERESYMGRESRLGTPVIGEQPAAGPSARSLKCTNCGAPHELKAGPQSQVLVCQYCDSTLDLQDPTFRVVAKATEPHKVQPLIPLNTKGKVRGTELECIGFIQRSMEVEGEFYTWCEYLLYSETDGYRWLAESNGHWTLIKTANDVPTRQSGQPVSEPPVETLRYLGKNFRHFQSYQATIRYVIGEFYWQVRQGDQVWCHDYVCPPYILSAEEASNEITWSFGEYVPARDVWQWFNLPGTPPPAVGVSPNQPRPAHLNPGTFWANYGLMVLLLLAVMILAEMFCSKDVLVNMNDLKYENHEAERARVTKVFEVKGRPTNIVVKLNTNLMNRWAFFKMALINEETGEAINFVQDVSYYNDGEESEGSQTAEVTVPSVPAGKYFLRFEPESGTGSTADLNAPADAPRATLFTYSLMVLRDVPQWGWAVIFIFVLMIFPIIQSIRGGSFEHKRWMESDHAPSSSS